MVLRLFFVGAKAERRVGEFTTFLGQCALVSVLVACGGGGGSSGGGGESTSGGSTIANITLSPPAASLQVAQTQQFVATAMDANGNPIPGVSFTWTSGNPAVASITSSGIATGLSSGSTAITASTGTVTSNPNTLTVALSTVSFIALTPTASSIQVGQTQQFVATALDANGNPIPGISFAWTSSNPTVASIDGTGFATAGLSGGTTTITAFAEGVTSSGVQLQVTTGGRVHATNFPLTENPISEDGNWINGGVGSGTTSVQTSGGEAYGTQPNCGTQPAGDSFAILTGNWPADQQVQATLNIVQPNPAAFQEAILLLRFRINTDFASGYAIGFRTTNDGSQYLDIGTIDGQLNSNSTFVHLTAANGYTGIKDGDVVSAQVVGSVITVFVNGAQVGQVTDSTYTSGSPGLGFFLQGCYVNGNSDWGYNSFSASSVP